MDGNEKLPEGWIKVQSKSRPDKVYFHNKSTGISLWKIEDLKNFKVKASKHPSTAKPAAAMAVQKTTSGVVSESKAIKKNGAKERMSKLQKKLSEETKQRGKQDPATIPRPQKKLPEAVKIKKLAVNEAIAEVKSSKDFTGKKNIAAQRMKKLNKQLRREESRDDSKKSPPKSSKSKVPMKKVETKIELPPKQDSEVEMMDVSYENPSEELLTDYEPMDWEEIPEEKIILEVQKIRMMNTAGERADLSPGRTFRTCEGDFFIIVDTNVLLSNVDFLREIKGKMFKGEFSFNSHHFTEIYSIFKLSDIGKATIFLPYIVLCELDRLKINEEKVARLARRSIAFIDDRFKERDPFFIGQSAVESIQKQIIPIESGDDEILNCCLQIQETKKKIILLTNDKNLRNKAFVNKIESFSRDMLYFVDFNVKNDIKFD